VFGKDTKENIYLGIYYSIYGLLEVATKKIFDEIGKCKIIATGGEAEQFMKFFDIYDPYLTIKGIEISARE
jgi:pantothenate kinase type III